MKRLFLILISIAFLGLISTYFLIPDQIIVSEAEHVETSERILEKYLTNAEELRAWWPESKGDSLSPDSIFLFNSLGFKFKRPVLNSVPVSIEEGRFTHNSVITWNLVSGKTMIIGWKTSIKASNNPIKRIAQYQHAKKIKKSMVHLLEELLTFVVSSKNVYGLNVEHKTVTDTILATTSIETKKRPTTVEIYEQIDHIKNYINGQSAEQVNAPMLNISRNPSGNYLTMVAVPVNKEIPSDSKVSVQKMIAGNILVAEVKGGPQSVAFGFEEMKAYMKDFKLTSPAMPFELLITNRIAEPDTSSWITMIYYPVL